MSLSSGNISSVPALKPDWLWIGLNLAVLGAILLPLVPIWTAAYTLLAIGWLWRAPPNTRTRLLLGVICGALCAIYLYGWIGSAVASPVKLVINGFIYVFGVPVGFWPSAAQLALQIVLVSALAVNLWPLARVHERLFIAANVGFALWSALSAVLAIAGSRAAEPDAVLIAASVWVNWSCFGLLVTALVTTQPALQQLLRTFVLAAMILACGMAVQLVIGDYSYVLTSAETADFFERVRGSYYYHAPPVQMLAVALPLAFGMLAVNGRTRAIGLAIVITISAVVLANSTRGISLSLAAGLAGFVILIIVGQRRVKMAILPLLVLAALLSQVFYVKPGTAVSDPVVSSSQPAVSAAEPAPSSSPTAAVSDATESVDAFVASNNARARLAEAGIKTVMERPITGSGPGNAQVEVDQTGNPETSSHVLGLDVAAMLGIPGLLFFIAIFGLPAVPLAIRLLISRGRSDVVIGSALTGALGVFAMSSLFHPQERSEIIALAFLLAGLATATFRLAPVPLANTTDHARPWDRRFLTGAIFVVLGFVGCLFVTSPSYVFPAIEFVLRYRQPLAEKPTSVVTNSPLLGAAVSTGLALTGLNQTVRTMSDDPSELALNDAYILWSPSSEKAYPRLREAAGIVSHARYGQWMGVNIPTNWWMLDSFQPNVQFLKAGFATSVPIAVEGLESMPISAGEAPAFSPRISPASRPNVDVMLRGADGNTAMLQQGSYALAVNFNQVTTVPLDAGRDTRLTLSGATAEGVLTVTERPALLPSVTKDLRVRVWVDGAERGQDESSKLTDYAGLGGITWLSQSAVTIELSGDGGAFQAYRFEPMATGGQVLPLPRAWIMEASLPDGTWVTLDQQNLARDAVPGAGYFVDNPRGFSLLRIVFAPDLAGDAPPSVGLDEIELFPTVDVSTP